MYLIDTYLESIKRISSNDHSIDLVLLDAFILELSENKDDLGNALEEKSLENLRKILHKLKPTIQILGHVEAVQSMFNIRIKGINSENFEIIQVEGSLLMGYISEILVTLQEHKNKSVS